jgi:hypothetical protein
MTPGRLVLKVQILSVVVGLVSCLWLDDVRAAENEMADVVLRNGKIYTADPRALSNGRSPSQATALSLLATMTKSHR